MPNNERAIEAQIAANEAARNAIQQAIEQKLDYRTIDQRDVKIFEEAAERYDDAASRARGELRDAQGRSHS